MTAKSEAPPVSDTAHVLSGLARVKAVFQQRALVAHVTEGKP